MRQIILMSKGDQSIILSFVINQEVCSFGMGMYIVSCCSCTMSALFVNISCNKSTQNYSINKEHTCPIIL